VIQTMTRYGERVMKVKSNVKVGLRITVVVSSKTTVSVSSSVEITVEVS
jgi:hypothetical protein